MRKRYPNLELLEYKALLLIKNSENLSKKSEEIKERYCRFNGYEFVVDVFEQIWGSTCTAFDECEDGSPSIGGSAMTEAYTVVFYEKVTDIYFVFVDNKFCYYVEDANEVFLNDLRNRNIKSLSEAKKVY